MIIQVNKSSLFSLFQADDFGSLEKNIDNMPPSMVEYHLSDLLSFNDDYYFNKKDIQNSFTCGDFKIYLDYSDNLYLESFSQKIEATNSFGNSLQPNESLFLKYISSSF